MEKFIKCKDKNGKIIMVATDTKTQGKMQRQGFPVILASKEEMLDAYLSTCGFVREVTPETELSKFMDSVGYKRKYADKSIIALDEMGRRWAVCLDAETATAHSTLYMAHKFIATVNKNRQEEIDMESGVFIATLEEGVLFLGLSVYAHPEDQLIAFCEINGLEVIE